MIDTHTHAVSPATHRYPLRPAALANGAWWDEEDTSVERLLAGVDDSDVGGVLLVQAVGAYGFDNTYLGDAVAADHRLAGCVVVDPTDDGALGELRRLAGPAGGTDIVGLRLFHIPTPADSWLGGSAGDALVDEAAELELTVSVCCQEWDLGYVDHQLRRRPDVTFVLEHCGFVDFGDPPYDDARPLWDLADRPNLVVKITPTVVSLDVNIAEGHEIDGARAAAVVRRFGPDRVVWGSDWPQLRLWDEALPPGTRRLEYREVVGLVASWFDEFSAEDRARVLDGNARRLWPGAWPMHETPDGDRARDGESAMEDADE